ncbi:MAG TPA: thiazolylpeptide-type bacteriocin [Frankiaceae bacterium]|nr:thiazolylpeptide-type bacteriocin [Frankiaceae bacterium]
MRNTTALDLDLGDLALESVSVTGARDAVALPETGASSGSSSCHSCSCCGSCSCCCDAASVDAFGDWAAAEGAHLVKIDI